MEKYMAEAVIFDLDGTVADTLEDLRASVNYAVGLMGIAPYSRETVQSFIGSGAANLVKRALGEKAGEENIEKTLAEFRAHYAAHLLDRTAPYPGVPEMLAELKERGFKLAITSNKPDIATVAIANALYPGVFDCVLGEKAGIARKPDPAIVKAAMENMGVKTAVYVGDSDVDVKTAENAGLPGIFVTWGFRTEAEMRAVGGKVFVTRAGEISDMLERAK